MIFMGSIDYIVVGLGNPGREYEKTRHNVGFMALDFVAKKISVNIESQKFKSLTGLGKLSEKKLLLIKPQTFMNLSGQAIFEAASFYKVPLDRVIVIFDDVSLPCGKIRLRKKGSHGGHNGVKNIISLFGSDVFPRIKVGVGDRPNPQWPLSDWVLSKFNSEDMLVIEKSMENIYESLKLIVCESIDCAMNKFN